jgi:hypothetical protein
MPEFCATNRACEISVMLTGSKFLLPPSDQALMR